MTLHRLQVTDFRCLQSADLELDPSFTLLSGPNASGKTSLLEAVYVLGRGRSFRTRRLEHLIRMGRPRFVVFGEVDLPSRRCWQQYQQALKQRNAAIKSHQPREVTSVWDGDLVRYGDQLTSARSRYVDLLAGHAGGLARNLLGMELALGYRPGWTRGMSLSEALTQSWVHDQEAGATQVGPQRAELSIRLDGMPVKDRISRGQQKLLAAALFSMTGAGGAGGNGGNVAAQGARHVRGLGLAHHLGIGVRRYHLDFFCHDGALLNLDVLEIVVPPLVVLEYDAAGDRVDLAALHSHDAGELFADFVQQLWISLRRTEFHSDAA